MMIKRKKILYSLSDTLPGILPHSQASHTKPQEPLWARIVSLMLHPLFMASYGIALLFVYTDFSYIFGGQFFRFLIPIVVLTCIIPLSCLFTLVQMGIVSDFSLKNKEERLLPFVIALITYGLLFYYFYQTDIYAWFKAMLAAPIVLLLIGVVINRFWKISAHMLSMGCLIGSMLSICYNIKGVNPYILFIILFILAGTLGTSRVVLHRHTPSQVYGGFMVGLVVSYMCIWLGAELAYM